VGRGFRLGKNNRQTRHLTAALNALKICVSLAALTLVLVIAPLSEIWDALASTSLILVSLAIVLQLLLRLLTAWRMQLIARIQGLALSLFQMLRILFATAFYGLFLPGSLAGGVVTFAKYVQHGATPASALTSLFANKGLEIMIVVLLGTLFWHYDQSVSVTWLVPAFVFTALAVIGFRLVCEHYGNLHWLTSKLEREGDSKFHQQLATLLSQVAKLGTLPLGSVCKLLLLAAVSHLLAAASMHTFASAMGIHVSYSTVMWVFSAVCMMGMLPLSIGNLGVREATMIFLLQPFGVSAAEAAAWSFLMYGGLVFSAMVGALGEGYDLWRQKGEKGCTR
jgi:uncharacterized protein (TIRG00374 family)